jgi:hypothetical protein
LSAASVPAPREGVFSTAAQPPHSLLKAPPHNIVALIASMSAPISTSHFTTHEAFGVFGTALREKIGAFHSSAVKMVPKTPNASSVKCTGLPRLRVDLKTLL